MKRKTNGSSSRYRATVRVIAAPRGARREAEIDAAFLTSHPHSLLILPTRAAARLRQRALLPRLPGQVLLGPRVVEFADFAQRLLEAQGIPVRRVDVLERRLHVQRVLTELAALPEYAQWQAQSETTGFARQLLGVINQLKQAAIEPAEFSARVAPRENRVDSLVAGVYARYQVAVKEARGFDVPGLYWEAYAQCSQFQPKFLDSIQTLLFDGFDDFTPSELRLIEALGGHVREMVIGVNYDQRAARGDVFALPRQTVNELHQRFEVLMETDEAPAPSSYSEFCAEHIFWRERPPALIGQKNLGILPCSDMPHELEEFCRRARRLLRSGTSPESIAFAFPKQTEAAAPLRELAREYGIPLSITCSEPLARRPLGRLVLKLGEVASAWPRDAVLEVLDSPWGGSKDTSAFQQLAMRAQIVGGKDEWRGRLERLARRLELKPLDEEAGAIVRRIRDAQGELSKLRAAVDTLVELVAVLPQHATAAAHAAAWDSLFAQLKATSEARSDSGDAAAIQSVLATIYDACTGRELALQTFLEMFAEALEETSIPLPRTPGGVTVCDLESLRHSTFEHLFIGGLNEGLFPRPGVRSALYSDEDVDALADAGIALETRHQHAQREMLLFHHVLAAAHGEVVLAWRLQHGGREAAMSPYLQDVVDLLTADASVMEPMPQSDSFLPAGDGCESLRELRNVAFLRHAHVRAQLGERCAAAQRGAQVETVRSDDSPVGCFDGYMISDDIAALFARRYGAERVFSPSALETYLGCPFQFWVERVLLIDHCEAPEAEFDDRIRGTIMHDALRRLHGQFPGRPMCDVSEEEASRAMEEAVAAAFEQHGWKSATATSGLVRMEEARMRRVLQRYLLLERGHDASWRPVRFEVPFGDVAREQAPFEIEGVRLRGHIDRIDQTETRVRLIDYKSGSVPAAKEMDMGLSLQLAVYAMAAEEVIVPEMQCTEACYVGVGSKLRRDALSKVVKRGKPKWEQREAAVRDAVTKAVAGIRGGMFAPVRARKTCYGCGDGRACRYDESRFERKGARPVLAMSEEEDETCDE